MTDSRELQRTFVTTLVFSLRIVWPVLSLIIGSMVAIGIVIGFVEGWTISDSLYFSFVTGLTIGYGDLVPRSLLARGLAIVIGLCGILLTALLAAVAVKTLATTMEKRENPSG